MQRRRFTIRAEANAIACFALRNSYKEELRAGTYTKHLDDEELLPVTDAQVLKLMRKGAASIASLLKMKDKKPEEYWRVIRYYNDTYTKNWKK